MSRLIIAAAVAVVGGLVALWAQRKRVDAPTRPDNWTIPAQLDRADFVSPEMPWLVVVFSSATCAVCQLVVQKSKALASRQVAVQEVEYGADKALHERYGIDAVPTTVIVDGRGVVRKSFVGPISATDLWAAAAEVRDAAAPSPTVD